MILEYSEVVGIKTALGEDKLTTAQVNELVGYATGYYLDALSRNKFYGVDYVFKAHKKYWYNTKPIPLEEDFLVVIEKSKQRAKGIRVTKESKPKTKQKPKVEVSPQIELDVGHESDLDKLSKLSRNAVHSVSALMDENTILRRNLEEIRDKINILLGEDK